MDVTEHNSVRLEITTTKADSGNQWLTIRSFDLNNNQITEITFFGQQQIILGDMEEE